MNILALTVTVVSGLSIPECYVDAGNAAPAPAICTAPLHHSGVSKQSRTPGHTPQKMPLSIGTAAFCRGSLLGELPEHPDHERNLRHPSEANEAAPEIKHVPFIF